MADQSDVIRRKLTKLLDAESGFAGVAFYRDPDGGSDAAVMVICEGVDPDDFADALRTLAERVSPLIGEPVTTWNPDT